MKIFCKAAIFTSFMIFSLFQINSSHIFIKRKMIGFRQILVSFLLELKELINLNLYDKNIE